MKKCAPHSAVRILRHLFYVFMVLGAAPDDAARDKSVGAAQAMAAQRVVEAAKLRDTEARMAEILSKLDAISRAQKVTAQRLAARSDDLTPLLPIMERLSAFPAETLLAIPATPIDALRGVSVLHGIAHQIERDAELVRQDQAQLAILAKDQQVALQRFAAIRVEQTASASALDAQIAAAPVVSDVDGQTSTHAAAQAAQAPDVHHAIVIIQAEQQADEVRAQAEASRVAQPRRDAASQEAKRHTLALGAPAAPGLFDGSPALSTPVAGTISRSFGDATEAGPSNGVSYLAPPNARVVSPCAGRIVFAGPFRSFGLLLIADCGGGYHFVLAGFDRLDVSVGRQVQQGEPVGVMPGWDPLSTGARPSLYIELRRGGLAINPMPWFNSRS